MNRGAGSPHRSPRSPTTSCAGTATRTTGYFPEHYGDPDIAERWDCGPCHTTVDWSEATWVHPAKTPHGTYAAFVPTAPEDWVVACADCHPVATDYTQLACLECHTALDPAFPPHFGVVGNDTCMSCHVDGQI